MTPRRPAAFAALVIAAASWGSAATFIKFALGSWGPMTLLVAQLLSANVVLWAVFADSVDTLTMTAHQFAAGLALALPFAVVRWATGAEAIIQPRPASSWAAAIGVGIIGYGGSFLLYNFAIARVRAGLSSMILNLMPVFGVLTAIIVLRERVGFREVFGALLVFASIFVFPKEDEDADGRVASVPS